MYLKEIVYEKEGRAILYQPEMENKSILELSREKEIPHYAACGGQARCSTCRVMVLEGDQNLTDPEDAELELRRKKGLEKNIRLACQARLRGPVRLRRLVLDDDDRDIAVAESEITSGCERELAILFADIRGFTSFTEKNLPYDVIHVLDRYFKKVGDAILQRDGFIDKYMGDGLLALFGLEQDDPNAKNDPVKNCSNACLAALQMRENLAAFNESLMVSFGTRFRIGVGIHFGKVIVGESGHPKKLMFTALGDPVNVTSRIEKATKTAGCDILISGQVRQNLTAGFRVGRRFSGRPRGKDEEYVLHELMGTAELG